MLKLKSKKTFTLMELMISVVILLVVLGSLLFTFVQCMILNEQNSNLATATNDAQYVLEQTKARTFDEIDDYPFPSFTNLINETVSAQCSTATYSGACDVDNFQSGANLVQVVVNVSWTGRRGSPSAQLSTAIARTVEE